MPHAKAIGLFGIGIAILYWGWRQLWVFPVERGGLGFVVIMVGFGVIVLATMMLL